MKAQCIQAVTRAIGRQLNKQEVQDIEARIMGQMKQIARRDPQAWRQMPKAQQLTMAAQEAAQEISHEAFRRKANIARQALASSRVEASWRGYINEGRSGASAAFRLFEDVDREITGVQRQYFTEMLPVLDYMSKASRWLGWKHDQPMLENLVREIFGIDTGNAEARIAAKSWLDVIEAIRTRFNAGGGDVGKLDYAYLPQPHDAIKLLKVTADEWIGYILPRLDRSRYLTPEGRPLNDTEMRDFLRAAHETISTGGLNKMTPGANMGTGKLANRHADSRQIHFADANGYLQYMERFGRGNPVSAMISHINSMSRDIALVEHMGPNPNQTARLLLDNAKKLDGSVKFVGPVTAPMGWDALTGANTHPVNVRLADIAHGVRNVTAAVKLQGAFLSAFTDVGTLAMNAGYNRMPVWQVLNDLPKAFGKDYKDYANRVGLMAESMISDQNRWANGHGGAGWTSSLADFTMKATGLTAWTDALKRAFSVNMMGALGKLSRSDWGALDDLDRARLQRAGIDQQTFDVWRAATPENWRGSQMLTYDRIMSIPDAALSQIGNPESLRNKAATKLLGYITDETSTAITSPDLMARTIGEQGTQKGTIGGEVWRSLWLFKTFSVSILGRQIRRIKDINATSGGNAALSYGAGLIGSLTVLGGLSLQAKDLANGKDPRPVNTKKFWGAAFLQGGGMGIFGDLLYTALGGNSRGGQPNWTAFAGPVFGTGFDLANVTLGNVGQAGEGKDTNIQAELIRFTRQNTPLANLWYAKGVIDTAFVNEALEQANPGYLRRMRQRAQKDWGQDYWRGLESDQSSRMPDFGNLFAE